MAIHPFDNPSTAFIPSEAEGLRTRLRTAIPSFAVAVA
jgi:hypothetical protein